MVVISAVVTQGHMTLVRDSFRWIVIVFGLLQGEDEAWIEEEMNEHYLTPALCPGF